MAEQIYWLHVQRHWFIVMLVLLLLSSFVSCQPAGRRENHELRGNRNSHGNTRALEGQTSSARTRQADFKLFVGPSFHVPRAQAKLAEVDMFQKPEQWSDVLELLQESNGGYHFHDNLLKILGPGEAHIVADFFKQRPNITVSIEAGVYICNGTQVALETLANLTNYTSNGGRIDQWALESIFSRTLSGCDHKITTIEQVVEQAKNYVIVLKQAMPHLQFGLIDAVPHFSAGKYPPSNPQINHGDIRDALSALSKGLADIGTELLFYWADCPYEYSLNMANNTGFEKLEFIANYTSNELGIRMGKIFNSEVGGDTSDEMYYQRSLEDYHRYMATVPMEMTTDIVAEGWYEFPKAMIPETQKYSFMYTAKEILGLAANQTKLQ